MRLIDADALFENGVVKIYEDDAERTATEIIDKLRNAPAIEAVPVVHGEWIKEIGDIHSSGEIFYCSNCGKATFIPSNRILSTTNFRHFEKPNFCPNCCADMRKKVE